MIVGIVTPAPPGSHKGNRVTALRWARLLRQLGHRVRLRDTYGGEEIDILIALHAGRSRPSIERFARTHPDRPIVLAMTGTDLYEAEPRSEDVLCSLALATRIVVLQPLGLDALPADVRARAHAIVQSASAAAPPPGRADRPEPADAFEVCVLAHLRDVKDPLLAARAARLLPADSRVRVLHAGAALTADARDAARAEERDNPRYLWLGDLRRQDSLQLLRRCRLLLVTSRLEGGANVVSEALAAAVPVLSTRIPGSIGLLGADYPGYFPVGDAAALAHLLRRCESEPAFSAELFASCVRLAPLVDPARERQAWAQLLNALR
jgi:putative glycosyltransferase (TIGR04348 family)